MLHSSDGAALLRAVIDNPDEDTPRLMYADWLDEQGGESNVARGRIHSHSGGGDREGTERPPQTIGFGWNVFGREWDLLYRYGGDGPGGWWADLPKMDGVRFANVTNTDRFDRGFAWQVYASDVDAFLGARARSSLTRPRLPTCTSAI